MHFDPLLDSVSGGWIFTLVTIRAIRMRSSEASSISHPTMNDSQERHEAIADSPATPHDKQHQQALWISTSYQQIYLP